MISKEAIAYDLREARERFAYRQSNEAGRHLGLLMENLNYLLAPQKNRPKKQGEQSQACPADGIERENIEALRAYCEQATEAVSQGDTGRAQRVLKAAQSFWDALPNSTSD